MNKKAFTLIEILVAIAAGTIIIMALYSIYVSTSKLHRRNISHQELAQNGRIALERMSRDLRQAVEITTVLPPSSADLLNPPPNNIEFQDGHSTSQIRYIRYYLSGSDLHRQILHYAFSSSPTTWVKYNAKDPFNNLPTEYIDEDVIKADKISALQFYGENYINVFITTTDQTSTFSFKTSVRGRNI